MDGKESWRGSGCIWAASRNVHEGAVKELLESGVDVDEVNIVDETTPVYIAAFHGHEGVVEELVKAGADLKARNSAGDTSLHMSAARGHEGTVVELLLKAGADPNGEADDGRTPLSLAVWRDHIRVCSILLKAGANVDHDVMAVRHRTALKLAMMFGSQRAALVLMEHGASYDDAFLAREELEQLMRWSTEALTENNRQMEEKDAQMERLVHGIPQWCAQAASAQAASEGQQQGGNSPIAHRLQPPPGSALILE